MMKETTAALNRMEAELNEFRDDVVTPGLILKDESLKVIIALLRNSGQRLKAGKAKFEHIEEGQWPQRDNIPTTRMSTVILNNNK